MLILFGAKSRSFFRGTEPLLEPAEAQKRLAEYRTGARVARRPLRFR